LKRFKILTGISATHLKVGVNEKRKSHHLSELTLRQKTPDRTLNNHLYDSREEIKKGRLKTGAPMILN
jgi:hypothetical protein